jgi:polysaccharide export outer membrane protein
MKKYFFISVLLITVSLFVGSCITTSKVNYFQHNLISQDSVINKTIAYRGPVFEQGDILDITIYSTSKDVNELYATFSSQNIRTNQSYNSGSPVQNGFSIDTLGFIDVPNIGRIKALGKTKYELQYELRKLLEELIVEPVVNVRLLNFKITILGDVKLPGVYQIPNDKVTLFEVIALAGDLNYSGNRKSIKLIRIEKGLKKEFVIDLTQSDHFDKDYFYLKQNDLLFIPTTSGRLNQMNYAQFYLPIISSLSLFIAFLNLAK